MTPQTLMDQLIRIRKQRGLRQREVADRMRVTPQRISHLEGGYRIPNVDSLLRYADAIGADVLIAPRRPQPQPPAPRPHGLTPTCGRPGIR